MIKNSIAFVLGLSSGCILSYIYSKKKIEAKNEEIEILRSYYLKKFPKVKTPTCDSEEVAEAEVKKGVKTIDEKDIIAANNDYHDYASLYKPVHKYEGERQKEPEKVEEESEEDESNGYETSYLVYYSGSDDLVDNFTGDILSVDLLGKDGADKLYSESAGSTIVCPNHEQGINYEIDIVEDPYILPDISND